MITTRWPGAGPRQATRIFAGWRLLLALAAGVITARSLAQPAGRSAIDQLLKAAVDRGDIPGVVAIACDRRGILYEGAFGWADTAEKRAMTLDALFHTASMTKPVTTAALMQCVESGRISLEDEAARTLPELARPLKFASFDPATKAYRLAPANRPIRIIHLATHTVGFGYPFTSATLRDFQPRPGETLDAPPLHFEPGTQWLYGTGIDYLGRIVEKLSGQTLAEYFEERIFRPLGMADTFYNVPAEKLPRVATIHRRTPAGELIQPPRVPPRVMTKFNGGGGLYSTGRDYARFVRMILNGGSLDGAKVLAPETVAAMGRNQIGAVNVSALRSAQPDRSHDLTFINDGRDKWGLGFLITTEAVPGKRSAGSLSWGGINNTYFWIDPARGVGGIILLQLLPFADPRVLQLYDAFERAVYRLPSRQESVGLGKPDL